MSSHHEKRGPRPAGFHTADRPGEPARYSGDWMNDSSGEDAAAFSARTDAGSLPCDCTLDWITLRHSEDCPSSHQLPEHA
ncbi:hypothetical protein BF14_005330 [Streptomyces griseus]|nr:hypothetical protein DIJ69_05335 [Streptomyces globisporus]PPA39224.1 hypothetical protein BF14_005330 [Streptomyces griseus]